MKTIFKCWDPKATLTVQFMVGEFYGYGLRNPSMFPSFPRIGFPFIQVGQVGIQVKRTLKR